MKIAYFVSNRAIFPNAPKQITASNYVVEGIIEHLKTKHEITLYAPEGSHCEGITIKTLGLAPFTADSSVENTDWKTKAALGMKQLYLGELFKDASRYDLLHIHTEPVYLAWPYVNLIKTPVLFTYHNQFHSDETTIFTHYDSRVALNAISHSQAKSIPMKQSIPVIHNGTSLEGSDFMPDDKGYFLFFSRLVKEKGIDVFMELAKKLPHEKFVISGEGSPEMNKHVIDFCERQPNVTYLSIIPRKSSQWHEVLGQAKALVMPIQWDEPFGLMFIEAMGHGTPVITTNRGSASEIVTSNKNGYLVNPEDSLQGFVKAISSIQSLSSQKYLGMRTNARTTVETSFTTSRMAADYEKLYQQIAHS